MKKRCPDCGLERKAIGSHRGSHPCRAEQVRLEMLRGHGLVPLRSLSFCRVLKWANVAWERVPANGHSHYHRPRAWAGHRRLFKNRNPDYSGPLYEGLGDVVFVEPWVAVLCGGSVWRSRLSDEKPHLAPLIALLRGVDAQNDEFKQALVTTYALGGNKAINVLLVAEGLWNSKQ